jgi:hypothetical protein
MKFKIENNFLVFETENDFIEMLESNIDKSQENQNINQILIKMIRERKSNLSLKQRNWINSKIDYIVKTNKRFRTIKGKFNDFRIEERIGFGFGFNVGFIEL